MQYVDGKRVRRFEASKQSAVRERLNSTSGGSRDTDENEFAVSPWSSSPSRVVMTVTPVTKFPSASRNRSAAGAVIRLPPEHGSLPRGRGLHFRKACGRVPAHAPSNHVGVLIITETIMGLQIVS